MNEHQADPLPTTLSIVSSSRVYMYTLTTGKNERVFLAGPCYKIYMDEAVGLKSCKYTLKITIL